MKKSFFSRLGLAVTVGAALAVLPVCSMSAADSTASLSAATPKLPYGVEDILKLTRAQINDDVVVNYIESSGTVYNLGAEDLVYLRKEGVSDRVINAMLDQRKRVPDAAAQAQAQAQAAQAAAQTQQAPPAALAPAPATAADQPTAQTPPTYVEAPLTPPPSSVYVVPYPAAPYPYYGYRPYYGYWGPSVSLGFRFGGGHHWGGHHR